MEADLQKAKLENKKISAEINADRAAIEKRSRAEDARWEKKLGQLRAAMRKAKQ